MSTENKICLAVWLTCIVTALVKFSKSCEKHPIESPRDFDIGWSILQRYQDRSDIEWTVLTGLFKSYWFLFFGHVLCTIIIFKSNLNDRLMFYSVYALFVVTYIVGVATSLVFLVFIAVTYIMHLTGKKSVCYIIAIGSIYLLHNTEYCNIKEFIYLHTEEETFLFDICLGWISAKCLSFAVDRIDLKINNHSKTDLLMVLAYCLYLPAFFSGPIISYESFCKEVSKSVKTGTMPIKHIALNILYLLYQLSFFFVYEFLLHYIYCSSISYFPDIVIFYDRWSICGLGYALPMMFYLKYFIFFGVAGSLSRFEGISLPPPPKCFTTSHRASFLHRHFDRGLYLWLLKYLYVPLMKTGLGRLYAQLLCFAFITLWHGSNMAICASTLINCCLVFSEAVARHLSTYKVGIKFQKLSAPERDRIHAFLAAPHFLMLCVSCTFFLSNYDIGELIFSRILLEGDLVLLATLLVVMYCGCHVSINVKKYQKGDHVSIGLILGKLSNS